MGDDAIGIVPHFRCGRFALWQIGFFVSKYEQATLIIHTGAVSFVTDTAVQRHNERYDTVDFLGGLFFVGLDVPGRVLAHDHILSHPPQDRVAAMNDVPLHQELEQLFAWRGHIFIALTEGHHRETVILQILNHLCGIPPVNRYLTYIVQLCLLLDEFLYEPVVDDVPFSSHDTTLPCPYVVWNVVTAAAKLQCIFREPEIRKHDVFLIL